jgi:hypothetical protein
MRTVFAVRRKEAHGEDSCSPCVYLVVHYEHYFHRVY